MATDLESPDIDSEQVVDDPALNLAEGSGDGLAPPSPDSAPADSGAGDVDPGLQPEAAPAAGPTLREIAGQYGLHHIAGAPDESSAAAALLQEHLRASQYAYIGEQYAPHRQFIDQALASRGQIPMQPQAPQAPAEPVNPLGAPPWNDAWKQYIVVNPATGREDWRAGTPAEVIAGVQKFAAWKRDFDQKWATNPVEALRPALEHYREEVRRELQGDLDNRLQGRETQNEMLSYLRDNASWIYQTNQATGEMLIDPRTNSGVYTPAGQRLHFHVENLLADGVRDPRKLLQYATAMLVNDMSSMQGAAPAQAAAAQPPATAPAAPTNGQANQNHRNLRGVAARLAGRGGSLVGAGKPGGITQNPRVSVGQMLRDEFRTQGVSDANLHYEE